MTFILGLGIAKGMDVPATVLIDSVPELRLHGRPRRHG
jgi:hypothetical protein